LSVSLSTKKPEASSMTVGQFLTTAMQALVEAEVESARLDVLVLLEDTLDKNRASLLAHPEIQLSPGQLSKLNNYITQRKKHVPLAYIRGRSEFYGRTFMVDEHVLVPRPETESMITLLKKIPLDGTPRIVDIGCGSGCIAVTAALELPSAKVVACDISPEALQVARKNAQQLKAAVQFAEADLLGTQAEHFDVVLANLPYVPTDYPINTAATFEPKLALFAGNDGLDLYRRLFVQLRGSKAHYVICESLEPQHKPLAAIAKTAGYMLEQTDGLTQLFVVD
jgi:release factor glutamine methyltransferase